MNSGYISVFKFAKNNLFYEMTSKNNYKDQYQECIYIADFQTSKLLIRV